MKKITTLFVILIGSLLFYLNTGLGFKFTETIAPPERRAIKYRFSDNILIQPAIIDYRIENGYVFGFRLPAYEASCEDGKYMSSLLSLEGMYFVLNLNDESYVDFEEEIKFNEHVKHLKLKQRLNSIELNDIVRGYESKYTEFEYFDTCIPQ